MSPVSNSISTSPFPVALPSIVNVFEDVVDLELVTLVELPRVTPRHPSSSYR